MTSAPVFLIKPTGRSLRWLRRFSRADGGCSSEWSYHDASSELDAVVGGGEFDVSREPSELERHLYASRWPSKCAHCGREFSEEDDWQIFCRREYAGPDGATYSDLQRLPVGACYDAPWYSRKGPDGRSLHVMTPGGLWGIDERASNCTLPDDLEHRCWVRRGSPEAGDLHVDKQGRTCAAGAGSIDMNGRWHGFLTRGKLQEKR